MLTVSDQGHPTAIFGNFWSSRISGGQDIFFPFFPISFLFYYICAACNFFLPTSAWRKFFFKITHSQPPSRVKWSAPKISLAFFHLSHGLFCRRFTGRFSRQHYLQLNIQLNLFEAVLSLKKNVASTKSTFCWYQFQSENRTNNLNMGDPYASLCCRLLQG